MPWDPFLIFFFLNKVVVGPMNSVWTVHEQCILSLKLQRAHPKKKKEEENADVGNAWNAVSKRTLHLLSKSDREVKKKTPNAFVHLIKVWKKDIFKSWINISVSSNVLAFFSLQIPHIKQWGITFQSTPFLCFLNLPDQLARRSNTSLGITQNIPKSVTTILHNSLAIRQCRSKWLKPNSNLKKKNLVQNSKMKSGKINSEIKLTMLLASICGNKTPVIGLHQVSQVES